MKLQDKLISIIAPLSDAESYIVDFVQRANAVLDAHYEQFELILVDDGSVDATVSRVQGLLEAIANLRYIRLSRRFGIEVALTAGLDAAIGDYCVVLIPGLDPPGLIPKFVEECARSGHVVLGQNTSRVRREGLIFRLAHSAFHWFCRRLLGFTIPHSTTYFVALNRRAVHQINRTEDKFRFLKAITMHIGLAYTLISYEFESSASARSFRGFWQSVAISIDIIVFNSMRPLRMAAVLSLTLSIASLVYVVQILAVYLFKRHVAEGWVTLSLQEAVASFVLFLVLAVMIEYLGRALQETGNRPLYYVSDELNSTGKTARFTNLNILSDSEASSQRSKVLE